MFPFAKSGPPPDPFVLTDYNNYPTYSTTAGRTSTSAALTPGEITLIAIVDGQSLAGNFGVTPYTPTNSTKVQNLHIPNNTLYHCADPVLGATGVDGSYIGRLGDKLIDGGHFDRVIFIPIAVGATSIIEHTPRGNCNHRLIAAALRAKAFGWLDPNPDVAAMVLWHQGEGDNVDGTTQAVYQSRALEVQGTLTSRGIDIPWLFAKSTMVENVVDADIQAAQDALVDHSANRYAGPNIDSLTGSTNRQAEGTHLKDVGNDAAAALWVTAITAAIA